MTEIWTRSQPQELTPFFGAQAASTLLSDAAIALRPGAEPILEPRMILDADGMRTLDPTIHLNVDREKLSAALGDRTADYDLILTVRTPQLLRRALAGRWSCGEELPSELPVDFEALRDARLSGSVELGLAICLRTTVTAEEGWPEFPGSRLAGKTFVLGVDRREAAFVFEELTDEIRAARKLPEGTTFVVDVSADELEIPLDDDRPLATVYVAPLLLGAIRAGAVGAAGNAILSAEIVDTVLEAANTAEPEGSIDENSGLARLMGWASDDRDPMPWEDLRSILQDRDRRRALVQHRLRITDVMRTLR